MTTSSSRAAGRRSASVTVRYGSQMRSVRAPSARTVRALKEYARTGTVTSENKKVAAHA